MRILLSSEALFDVIAPVYTIWWTIIFFKIDRIKSFETNFNQWSKKMVAYRWELRYFWRSRELYKGLHLTRLFKNKPRVRFGYRICSILFELSLNSGSHVTPWQCQTQQMQNPIRNNFVHLPTKVYITIEVRWVFKTLFSEKDHETNTDVPQGSLFGPFFFVFKDLPKSIFRSFGKYLCRWYNSVWMTLQKYVWADFLT